MKKSLLIILIMLVLWFGLKNWAIRTWLSQGRVIETTVPDYRLDSSWLALPNQPAPAVWSDGWASDVFWLPAPSTTPQRSGLVGIDSPASYRDMSRTLTSLQPALVQAGQIYAPLYRFQSPASRGQQLTQESMTDRFDAFQTYANTYNRGRAFFIATDRPIDPQIAAYIQSDPHMLERFGGVIRLGELADASLSPVPEQLPLCSAAFRPLDCIHPLPISIRHKRFGFLFPQLPVRRASIRLAKHETGAALSGQTKHLIAWLEENGTRLAEPFGDFEEVGIAPVRRPGETDAASESDTQD